jgi:hypothetical protein
MKRSVYAKGSRIFEVVAVVALTVALMTSACDQVTPPAKPSTCYF